MTEPRGPGAGQTGAGKSGITLVVMSDEKLEALTGNARMLVETIQRQRLELIRAGLNPDVLKEGDGCCNCVAC